MFSAILLGASKVGKPDILIATSPQFFVGVAGYVISRLKQCKFVFEIRDLWPEEIVAVGAIQNRFVIWMLERLEMFLYRKADLLVPVAHGTIDVLVSRGIPRDKMVLIPNGVALDEFSEQGKGQAVKERLGLADKFVVGYIGTHGMAHRLSTVIEAAKLLKGHTEIQFLFVGDGAEKKKLVELAQQLHLTNVTFHDQVPRSDIPSYYQSCDLCLVPLRQAELFKKNIPSKIYEIMASRRPIIVSTEGESRNLVESSGAGVGSTPENAAELAEKILMLSSRPDLCDQMGRDGYTFALANCSRTRLADQYLEVLNSVVNGSRPVPPERSLRTIRPKSPSEPESGKRRQPVSR